MSDVLEKYSCSNLHRPLTQQLSILGTELHTHTHLLLEDSRCLCKALGIRRDASAGKLLLYRTALFLSSSPGPVSVSKLNKGVTGEPAPAN